MMAADFPSPTIDATSPRGRTRPSALARSAGWCAAAMLVAMSAVHAYWAVGGGWALGPGVSPRFDPLAQYGVVAVLMLGSAVLLAARAGALNIGVPGPLLRAGPGVLAGVFAVIGLSSVLLGGPDASDWQAYVFEPLVLLLAVLCAIVAGEELPVGASSLSATAPAIWIGLFDVRPVPGSDVLGGAIGAAVYAAGPAPGPVAFEQVVRRAAGELGLVVTEMEEAAPASRNDVRALSRDVGRLVTNDGNSTVVWGTLHPYDRA